MSKILEALNKLEVGNENHWTADGLPRIETVKFLAGGQSFTREEINAAKPGFSRATAGASAGTTAPATNAAVGAPATAGNEFANALAINPAPNAVTSDVGVVQAVVEAPTNVFSEAIAKSASSAATPTPPTENVDADGYLNPNAVPAVRALFGDNVNYDDDEELLEEGDYDVVIERRRAFLEEKRALFNTAKEEMQKAELSLDAAIDAQTLAGAVKPNSAIQDYLAAQAKKHQESVDEAKANQPVKDKRSELDKSLAGKR